MSYGFSFKTKKGQANHGCRESLQRLVHLQQTKREVSRKPITFTLSELANTKEQWTRFVSFADYFTQQLYSRIVTKTKIKGTVTVRRSIKAAKYDRYTCTYRATFPAAVLKNPQFASFYLGVLNHLWLVLCNNRLEPLTRVSLGKFLRSLNVAYGWQSGPTFNYPERKLAVFLNVYDKPRYLKTFFAEEKKSLYNKTNGFRTWYAKYGKEFVSAPKKENAP